MGRQKVVMLTDVNQEPTGLPFGFVVVAKDKVFCPEAAGPWFSDPLEPGWKTLPFTF